MSIQAKDYAKLPEMATSEEINFQGCHLEGFRSYILLVQSMGIIDRWLNLDVVFGGMDEWTISVVGIICSSNLFGHPATFVFPRLNEE